MGTSSFSKEILKILIANNFNITSVISQPDKQQGRNNKITFSPIKEFVMDTKMHFLQPIKIKDAYKEIKTLNPDLIITCAYGQFISQDIIDIPKMGIINFHTSLLPK